jgi:hypothetical protein
VPFLVRGSSTSRAPLHAGARPPVAAPLQASVPPHYRRFFALTGPAATLWPSVTVAGAYLAPGCFSPGPGGLHQFQRYPSLRAAVITPPEPDAAISQRSSAPDAAFAVHRVARLPGPIRIEDCTTFDACGPQRRSPASPPGLSGGTAPCFRHSNASPQLHGSLAVTVSRFSLAGLHRLCSGHADASNCALLRHFLPIPRSSVKSFAEWHDACPFLLWCATTSHGTTSA